MPDPSNPIRDTVRGTVRDVQEAARETSRAASAAGNDIRADVELLRSDVRDGQSALLPSDIDMMTDRNGEYRLAGLQPCWCDFPGAGRAFCHVSRRTSRDGET